MEIAMEATEKIVHDLVCERFSESAINKVIVRDDVDSDGDPVLRIVIVLELNSAASLDAKKMVGLVRHLRSRFERDGLDDIFPMISFVSKKEAGQLLEAC
jgi:hypothetical protein